MSGVGVVLGIGFGLERGDHCLDRRGAADGRAGGGQDVTFWLVGVVEASYGYSVVQDAKPEERRGVALTISRNRHYLWGAPVAKIGVTQLQRSPVRSRRCPATVVPFGGEPGRLPCADE